MCFYDSSNNIILFIGDIYVLRIQLLEFLYCWTKNVAIYFGSLDKFLDYKRFARWCERFEKYHLSILLTSKSLFKTLCVSVALFYSEVRTPLRSLFSQKGRQPHGKTTLLGPLGSSGRRLHRPWCPRKTERNYGLMTRVTTFWFQN